MSFLGCEQKKLILSTFFRINTRNSLFPQCKTSIGNNYGSIKHRAVKFAYSRGFSAISEQMVRPPSWNELLTRTSKLRTDYNLQSAYLLFKTGWYHMYYKIDQHSSSSSCKGTSGLLHIMGSNTMILW